MSTGKCRLFEQLERCLESYQVDDELPWVPGKVFRPELTQRCAMCGGELGAEVVGETMQGENVHECLDCGTRHRAIMARPRGRKQVAEKTRNSV